MSESERYRVCIIMPNGYIHSSAFVEVAFLLKASLGSVGIDCDLKLNEPAPDRINVILGSHLIKWSDDLSRYKYIPYQLEQLSANEGAYNENLRAILQSAWAVWDYSLENIEFLASQGITAHHLPVGYHAALEQLPTAPQKDVDVLFYGSIGGRRSPVLEALAARGDLQIKTLFGVYGRDRDSWISRSKMVLNVHYYAVKIFEAVRISYLLNNRCFVLSEESAINPYPGVSIPTATYDTLVDATVHYANQAQERTRLAAEAYEQFKMLYPMEKLVERVLQ